MSREDRDPADVLTVYALKEYERLQQEAPPVSGSSIKAFKHKFSNTEQAIPDVAEDKFVIHVTKPQIIENEIKINDVLVKRPLKDLEVNNSNLEVEIPEN